MNGIWTSSLDEQKLEKFCPFYIGLENKIPVKFEGIGTVSVCCFFLQVAR